MKAHAPIQADDKHAHIITDAHSSTYSQLFEEIAKFKFPSWLTVIFLEIPYIPCIHEKCSIKISQKPGTILQISQEFDITSLVNIGIPGILGDEFTGAYTSHIKSPYTISSPYIELFIIRDFGSIAISTGYTTGKMPHKSRITRKSPVFHQIRLYLQKLCIRILEHLLVFLTPLLPCRQISQ